MAIKKIDIKKLKVGMVLAHPIYKERENRNILLLADNTMITNDIQIKRLSDACIQTVEIDTQKGLDTIISLLDQQTWADITKEAKNIGATESIISRHIMTIITSLNTSIFKNFMTRNFVTEGPIPSLLKEIIRFIETHIDVLLALIRLRTINAYTFIHSINTMILCMALANRLKFTQEVTKQFGIGVLCSDLGMSSYPSKMLQRPAGLSKYEKKEIRKHPIYASDFLKKNGITDEIIHTIVMQHHERFNGSGYPKGLKGDSIQTVAKLFAIADTYDAMTTPRPHRPGIPPHIVLSEILTMSGTLYDPRMAELFIKNIGVFPVGSMVELTSGNLALVAGINRSDPLSPRVIVLQTKKKISAKGLNNIEESGVTISRGHWDLIDLSENSRYYGKIKRGLDHRKFRLNPGYYLEQV